MLIGNPLGDYSMFCDVAGGGARQSDVIVIVSKQRERGNRRAENPDTFDCYEASTLRNDD